MEFKLTEVLNNEIVDTTAEPAVAGTEAPVLPKSFDGSELLVPTPWADSIKGQDLVDEIARNISRHVVMDEGKRLATALWVINSYCFNNWNHCAHLAFQAPTKRAAKTIALSVVGAMALKPLLVANASGASIFRLCDKVHPTLLIDEADMVVPKNLKIRNLLNAAHNRLSARVTRVGALGQVDTFDVFGPKALALIGTLPPTIQDRSVVITLLRKRPDEKVEPLPTDIVMAYNDTRRKIARWVSDNEESLKNAKPELPDELNDRARDNWRSLLAIASVVGADCLELARASAIAIDGTAGRAADGQSESLLRDTCRVFLDHGPETSRLPVSVLYAGLMKIDEEKWTEGIDGRPLTKATLGRTLGAFGISSVAERIATEVQRVYRRLDFSDAYERYCPDLIGASGNA